MFDEKLPRSSFTAPEGYMEFLRRLGGEKTVSAGIRRAIETLIELDPKSQAIARDLQAEGADLGDLTVT